jgi:hypothetical protein
MLLARFNNGPFAPDAADSVLAGSILQPLVVTQTEWVLPDRSEYPNIRFWTATEYNEHLEATKESQASMKEEKHQRGKNPDLEAQRKGTAYLQHADGSWILEQKARAMTQFARSVFNDLRQRKMEAAHWKGLSGQASRYVYQELYRAYDFLLLCDNHWKIEKFASSVYAGWYRQIREGNGGDGKRVKKELSAEGETNEGKRKQAPTSPKTTKPSKQIKSSAVCRSSFIANTNTIFTLSYTVSGQRSGRWLQDSCSTIVFSRQGSRRQHLCHWHSLSGSSAATSSSIKTQSNQSTVRPFIICH